MIKKYNNQDKAMVAVDCIIFGFDLKSEVLKILLIKRSFEPEKGKWSLMGGFLKSEETITEAARRVLKQLTGLTNVYLEQLFVFSKTDRDPVERTISVAYYALISIEEHDEELIKKYSASWVEVYKRPKLIFDHDVMVDKAISRLRYRASVEPVGFELLPEKFTMRLLMKLYEAIYNEKVDKRNFAKKMNSYGFLKKLNEKDKNSSKKGSFLYRFDTENYEKSRRENEENKT